MEKYKIAVGDNVKSKFWINQDIDWKGFLSLVTEKSVKTHETTEEYQRMTKDERCRVKDVGGFVAGKIVNGERKKQNVWCRSMITLDIDEAESDTLDKLKEHLNGLTYLIYSTHSATKEQPRYRVILPLKKEVHAGDYVQLSKELMNSMPDIKFDQTSSQAERMMFWPSTPSDQELVFIENEGKELDANHLHVRTSNNAEERPERHLNGKMEDPRDKKGLIGTFCRCYGIKEAIQKYLRAVYTPFGASRYTYVNGSTSGGLVVYDNLLCYSNHSTDPICGHEVNSWDLVRIHLFGNLDTPSEMKNPMNRRKSYLSMEKMLKEDSDFQAFKKNEERENLKNDFGELSDEDADWMADMDRAQKTNECKATVSNIMKILENDKNIKNKIRRNVFEGKDVVEGELPWRKYDGEPRWWKNDDLSNLIVYIGTKYGIQNKDLIITCFDAEMSKHEFHPVKEYFNSLVWDGTPRLETLFINYLGADDTNLTRTFTRKHLIAEAMRVLDTKIRHYDAIILLIGEQGIGKTTILRKLAKEKWFCDNIGDIDKKESIENTQGKILVISDEFCSCLRSKTESLKAWISRDMDRGRMVYMRYPEDYKRQFVLFATSNESNILKDITGNRRFLPILCDGKRATKSVFKDLTEEVVDQIWAEAVYYFRHGESYIIDESLKDQIQNIQDSHTEIANDERVQIIEAYLDQKLPFSWDRMDKQARKDFFLQSNKSNYGICEKVRNRVSAVEIANECFNMNMGNEKLKYATREINAMMRYVEGWKETGKKYERENEYGRQRYYERENKKEDDYDELADL